jgi:MFS family permease
MAFADSFWWLMAGYLFLQIASNAAHGPAQGLIPDLVPEGRRGLASGIKNLFDMGGLVVTSLVAGQLMGGDNPALAFALIGGVLLVSTAITVLGTPERPAADPMVATGDTRDFWRADWRDHRDYAWLLVSRYLILLGIYAVQGFAQYYVRDWLGAPNAAEVTGNLMAAIGLALTLLVFPAGWLSDRVGRWQLNVLAGALAALGIFLLVFARSLLSLYLFGGLIGAATGIFLSVNWALATDLIPPGEAGKYLGLSNLATAGAGATARLAGPLIDGVNALRPGMYLGYPAVFVLASVVTLAGTVLLVHIRKVAQVPGT